MAPGTERIIDDCLRRGQFIQGPAIVEFEQTFARRMGQGTAVGTSYGRMAFYLMLKALDLPAGSEIILPALTFWVIPELARVAGLRPVFADIDPATFTLDPGSFERAIGPHTRVVVPTHLFGLPCDMDAIMAIAERHQIAVIEDCAHALGATYKGQPVGTLRRRRALQLSDAQAAERVWRRHGARSRPGPGRAGGRARRGVAAGRQKNASSAS